MFKSIWATLVVFGVALLSFGSHELEITHHSKWAILGIGILLSFAFSLSKIHWSLAAPFAVTTISAFLMASYPKTLAPPEYDLLGVMAMGHSAAWALGSFLLVVGFVAMRTHQELKTSLLLFGWVGVFLSGALIVSAASFGRLHSLGILGNYSMTGSLIALSMPFAYLIFGWRVFIPMLLAIGLTFSSVPYAVAGLVLVLLLPKYWQKAIILLSGGVPLIIFPDLLNSSGRFPIWSLTFPYLSLSGIGGGATSFFMPKLQIDQGFANESLFFHLHNDWLQLVLENGWVGLVAYLILFWNVAKKAYGSIYFAPVMGYALCAFFNYPSHMALHALFGAALVFCVLREPSWAR